MSRIIVIGAGAVGISVATRLAMAGAQVTILEANRAGGGTSGTSFAWANSHDKAPLHYHQLNMRGMQAHAALADEFGASPWWHGGGCLEWAAPHRQAEQKNRVARLQETGYAVDWLGAREVVALEPDIDAAAIGDTKVAFYRDEGWLALIPYIQAMWQIAKRHGASLRQQTPVKELLSRGGQITGVRTGSGEVVEADWVVNCAGRWADLLEPAPGLALPLSPSYGMMLFTPPIVTSLQRVVRAPECNMRPDGDGRLLLRRAELDDTVNADTKFEIDSELARDLVSRATRVLPAIYNAPAEASRVGIRPMPRDGLPAIGTLGVDGYYVVVTHSGATLSALLGQLVAKDMLSAKLPELEPYRPGRLFN